MPRNLSPALIALRDRLMPTDVSAPLWRISTRGKSEDPRALILSFGGQPVGSIRLDEHSAGSRAERACLWAAADLAALTAARPDLLKLLDEEPAQAPGADDKSVAQWIEAVKTAEGERDAAKKQEAVWKENYHLAAQERTELRQRKDNLEAEQRLVARLRADNEQIGKERDQARADNAAADVALQETLDDLKKARLQRDAAEADRNVWEKAAKEDRAQLVTLADKLNQATQKLRDIEKLRESDTIEMGATILGYRILTVVVFFVVSAIAIWKGVGR
jgi:hypothetical protein